MSDISGNSGNNTLTGGNGGDRIYGGAGNDVLNGQGGNDSLDGGSGNDILDGAAGNDDMDGGSGNDQLFGGTGNDDMDGGSGNDVLDGGTGNDEMEGGSGNDTLWGRAGNDWIDAGSGNDTADGNAGSDELDLGSGNDLAIYNMTENAGAHDEYDGGSGNDTLRLEFTRAQWLTSAVQNDIRRFLDALNGGGGWCGDDFDFNAFNLDASDFEALQVTVDGVALSAADDGVDAINDAFTVAENATVGGQVLTNDVVPDLVKTVSLVSGPSAGLLSFNTDGTFTFDTNGAFNALNAGQTATVTFTYRVTDADGDTDTATVTITVTGVGGAANQPPIVTGAIATGSATEIVDNAPGENTTTHTATGTVSFTDANISDSHTVTVAPVGSGYRGTLTASITNSATGDGAGVVTWNYSVADSALDNLAAGQVLTQSYTLTINDGNGGTTTQTVAITFAGTNDAPVVTLTTLAAIAEDSGARLITQAELLANATDIDGPAALSATNLQIGTGGGALVDNGNGTWSYTPALDDGGAVSFTYDVTDGISSVATSASLDITAVADAPSLSVADATGDFAGGVFQVNQGAPSPQAGPDIASFADGRSIVVWTAPGNAGVIGQMMSATGTPIGGEFAINFGTYGQAVGAGSQIVDTLAGGGYVVVWQSAPGGGSEIFARVFDSAGAPIGNDVQINQTTSAGQTQTSVIGLPGGGFVVAWVDDGASGPLSSGRIVGRVFDANGVATGNEVVLSTTVPSYDQPQWTVLADGGLLALWGAPGVDSDQEALIGRRFDANLTPLSDQFQINTTEAGRQHLASAATLADGSVVVTWSSLGQDGSDYAVVGQRFAVGPASMTPIGGEFLVNTTTAGFQFYSQVTATADGGFVITWQEGVATTGADRSLARFYAADGTPISGEIQLDTPDDNFHQTAAVSVLPNSDLFMVWASGPPPWQTGVNNIMGRIFDMQAEDTPIALSVSAALADTDGSESLGITIAGVPAGATLSAGTNLGGGTWSLTPAQLAGLTLTPPANFHGSFDLTVTATATEGENGHAASTSDTLSVFVSSVNDAAILSSATVNLVETNAVLAASGTLSISDIDSPATFVAQAGTVGTYGTFTIGAGGAWSYTASSAHNDFASGVTYTDTFTVASADGTTTSVTINILGTNDGPVAVADTASGGQNEVLTIDVLANDSDVDSGDSKILQSVSVPPGKGSVSIDGNKLVFNPGTDFADLPDGVDATVTVNYTMRDAAGAMSSSTVTITVNGANDTPVAAPDTASVSEDATLSVNPLGNDTDADAVHVLSLVSASAPLGTATVNGNQIVFTPGEDFNDLALGVSETVVVSYTMQDEVGATSTSFVTVTVHGANDAPITEAGSGSTSEDGPAISLASPASDPDAGNTLTYSFAPVGTVHGSVAYNSVSNSFVYTPNANFGGVDFFTYTATDNHDASSTGQLSFIVNAVADVPTNLSVPASVSGEAGSGIPLNISVVFSDLDGSEQQYLEITDVPPLWQLSAGQRDDATGVWTVPRADITGLTITPPSGDAGTLIIGVRAVAAETSNGDTASTAPVQQLTINVASDAESFLSGDVVDGYIAGATVFTDLDGDEVFDPGDGEVSAITDANGHFNLINPPLGGYTLVMKGGVDVSTGLAFESVLRAPEGSTVVTPLTTLIIALMDTPAAPTAAEAEAQVRTVLGIAPTVNLTTFDPVQEALANNPDAAAVFGAGVQVANALALASSAVEGAGGSAADAIAGAVGQLATQIADAFANAETVNLADPEQLESVVNAAADAAIVTIDPALVAAAAEIAAQSNAVVENAVNTAGNAIDLLTEVAQAAVVAQGAAADAMEEAVEDGDATAATLAFTGAALTDSIADAEAGDVDGGQIGTLGNDSLVGGNGADAIDGLSGADLLFGGGGNDVLIGALGNDTIQGGAGDDVINAGFLATLSQAIDFNDLDVADYAAATSGVVVNLAAGTATGDASVGSDTLIGVEGVYGTAHNDTLTGSSLFFEFFRPGAGDDTITGNGGYDRVSYADATSAIAVDLADGTVTGDASVGSDTLSGIEDVRGTNFADTYDAGGYTASYALVASTNSDDAYLGGTYNQFEGGGGNDTIYGNGGTRITYQNAAEGVVIDFVQGKAFGGASVGTDTFTSIGSAVGSNYVDTIYGSGGNERFSGKGGNDTIFGGAGFDRMDYSRDGAITVGLTINLAAGQVIGDAALIGTDTIRSIEGARGSSLADVYNAVGFSSVSANSGNAGGTNGNFNEFEGAAGNDTITGNGNTRIAFYDAREGVTIDFTSFVAGAGASGIAVGGASVGTDTFTGVASANGSAYNDTILGSGNTTVTEQFDAGAGDDMINGRGGLDRAIYSGAQIHGIVANLGTGGVVGDISVGTDTLIGVEAIIGTEFGDTIDSSGVVGYNEVEGRGGNDTFLGNNNTHLTYFGANSGVSLVFSGNGAGVASGTSTGLDTFTGVNRIALGNFNDTVNISATSDTMSIALSSGDDTFFGGTGNATVFGDNGNDVLDGGGGNNTINGGNGNDSLSSGAGHDSLFGGSGNDVIVAGDGNNTVFGDNDNDVITSGSGTDTLNGGNGNDSLSGGAGDDVLNDFSGNNWLSGGEGNDSLFGGTGNDVFLGGDGNDNLTSGDGDDTLSGGAGNNFLAASNGIDTADYSAATGPVIANLAMSTASGSGFSDVISFTMPGDSDIENLIGSTFDDTLTGDNTVNVLSGGDGNDSLFGGDGGDTLYGGAGNDTYDGGSGADTYVMGGGGDTIVIFSAPDNDKIVIPAGTFITNTLFETPTYNFSDGSSVTLTHNFSGQHNFLNPDGSQAGRLFNDSGVADFFGGTAGSDLILGGNGNDGLSAGAGNDTIYGGIGNDNLQGQEGDDKVLGDAGNDNLQGQEGNDTLDGGAGIDNAQYFSANNGVVINLALGTATGDSLVGSDTLISIEGASGGNGNDVITGTPSTLLNNNLFGGGGNDTLNGDYGNDFLQGGAGNDTLDGGYVADYATYERYLDFDNVDYFVSVNGVSQADAGVVINLAAGTAIISSGAFQGTDILLNIEGANGTNHADTFYGGGGGRAQNFQGRGGNDTIIGDGTNIMRVNYGEATVGSGITIDVTAGFDGSTTVSGNGSIGLDTLQYVTSFSATRNNDVYNGALFNMKLADPTFTGPYNVFRGNGGSDTIYGNGRTVVEYNDGGSAGITANLATGIVVHGISDANFGGTGGSAGTDTLYGVREVIGSNFNDTMYGGGTSDLNLQFEMFRPGSGNDTFFGGSGFDEIQYSDGNNQLTAGVTITMFAGTDAHGDYGTATGGGTYDSNSPFFNQIVFGLDRFYGVEGARGSLLHDTYNAVGFDSGNALNTSFEGPFASATFNRFNGYAGNDVITGNGHTQLTYSTASAGVVGTFTGLRAGTVVGNASVGTDTFTGVLAIADSQYADTFYGSDANGDTQADVELFNLSGGNDTVFGGLGFDRVSYSSMTSAITADLGTGIVTGTSVGTDTLNGVEGLFGSQASDTITGSGGADLLAGLGGSDTMNGAGGVDTVTYFYDPAGVSVDLATGVASDGYGNTDALSNVENVTGSRFADTIAGDGLDNVLNGADGNDVLTGGGGADTFAFGAPVGVFIGSDDDVITDFLSGTDSIDVAAYDVASFAALMAMTTDVSGSAVIQLTAGDSVTISGLLKSQLQAGDFIL